MLTVAAHGHHIESKNQRALVISAILTGVYFVVELVAGLLVGSVAVLSDAGSGALRNRVRGK